MSNELKVKINWSCKFNNLSYEITNCGTHEPNVYHMTHNKKKQDLLYFKGIIDEYHIDLKVIVFIIK